ncbi:MAG: GTP 3',8-cyclase MoaA [Anaerolineales bacterium]|nr:GTP 3',8-cyclase MoaA [Anaerolineales bacterium]MCS7246734.1 GTP 3',8-cyclase MoaA [Anaerolineales bacterium]MDW8160544.1 GTP 3',8-cyclase MoaA [Anaerolineales bacterium]MDW8447343.1 GTP 3',8-cyclase MoaA [Anaerolineales bacterium]
MAFDRFGRRLNYLRISLTDHCNLRCLYCMPEEMVFRPNHELMQDEEVLFLARLFVRLGFDKIRLTGGEPTVRMNVVELVREIAAIEGLKTLTMTTNGILLPKLARKLKDAGLQRVNISLDTLQANKFRTLTRWGKLEDVWAGIRAAEEAGLTPVKINAVVVRNYNEEDVVEIARLTLDHPWQVRFIEMMPFGGATEFQLQQLVTMDEVFAKIEAAFGPLDSVHDGELDGEARVYRIPGAQGELGFIASVTKPFCALCTRARLTADGKLRLCLLREGEVDLLTPLRQGASEEELRQLILAGLWEKPWGHGLAQNEIALNRVMSEIGG